jgi:TRAP-type C4-dicarboxylate transport system permease small subunit
LICPVCEREQSHPGDWCTACGAYLGLLRRRPHRVAYSVCASVLVGLALFAALAWQVFAPVLKGWPPSGPGPWFWLGFLLATFFLGFGLTAAQHLASAIQRIFGASTRKPTSEAG